MLRFCVDDDRRGVPGALRQPVYRVRPVVEVGPEDDPAGGVERTGAVPALADVDPRVGRRPVLLRCAHGASSPLSRPEAAEATPALPGRGVARPARLYQSFPRRRTRPGGNAPPGALGDRSGRGRTAIRGGRPSTIGTARSYPRISSMDTELKERAALADGSNCNGCHGPPGTERPRSPRGPAWGPVAALVPGMLGSYCARRSGSGAHPGRFPLRADARLPMALLAVCMAGGRPPDV